MKQDALQLEGLLDGPPSRVELAAGTAVEAAQAAGVLETTDQGMAALVVELSRAVDVACRVGAFKDAAALAKEVRESSARLRLDPVSRGEAAGDAFADLLAELGTPSTAQVRNRP